MGSSHKLIAIIKWETCESVEHESTQVVYLWDCLVLLSHDSNMSVTAWIYVGVRRQHKKKGESQRFYVGINLYYGSNSYSRDV